MEYLTRNIRNLLETVLNDEELEIFCFDNFVPVYKKFTRGQSQTSRIQTLIAYAEQHGLFDTLLREVEQINPVRYPEFMPYVKTEGVPEGSIGLIQSACEKAPVATESGAVRFRVSIIPPNHPARIYLVFTTGRVTFGGPKDTQADVVIRSPGVKTGHGRIVNENGSFYLCADAGTCALSGEPAEMGKIGQNGTVAMGDTFLFRAVSVTSDCLVLTMDYSDPVDSSLSGIVLMKHMLEIGPDKKSQIVIPQLDAQIRLVFEDGAFHAETGKGMIGIPFGGDTDLGGVKLFVVAD